MNPNENILWTKSNHYEQIWDILWVIMAVKRVKMCPFLEKVENDWYSFRNIWILLGIHFEQKQYVLTEFGHFRGQIGGSISQKILFIIQTSILEKGIVNMLIQYKKISKMIYKINEVLFSDKLKTHVTNEIWPFYIFMYEISKHLIVELLNCWIKITTYLTCGYIRVQQRF